MPEGTLPQTISEEGKLPEERFENANQLRDFCRMCIKADDKRTALRSRVENLFNGFPSYPRGKVTEGFGWFPRVNYRELEGLISQQATPLYDLVTEVPSCIEVTFDDTEVKASSAQELEDWQEKFAKHFTWLLFTKCRQTFNYNFLLQQREMLLHGLGYHVNINKRWIPRTPRAGQIIFPAGCPLNFHEDGKVFLLRDFMPGEDVYASIRNEGAARKNGWQVENVWKTLVLAQKQYHVGGRTTTTGQNQALNLQRYLRRGDIGYSNTSQVGLWMNWVFVHEYDYKDGNCVSLYGIEENISGQRDFDNKGYLFVKRFTEEEFPVTLFPFDIGNGEIDSVRGLGMRAKDFFELSNRMKNAMVAQVLISAFPQVKQTVPDIDPDKLRLMRIGAMSLLPYGVDYGMMNFPPLNNTGIALSKELRDTLGENLAAVQSGAPEPRDRETATSYSLRAHDDARISNGLLSLYESNLQHFYERTVRLLLATPKGNQPHQKLAEEFRQRCRKDGIPEAALKPSAIMEVQEVTSQGAGSAAARFQSYMTLLNTPVYANAPEEKKIAIERALVATQLGQVNVDRFARSVNDQRIPTQDDSMATVESSTLSQGGDAQVSSGQDDVLHTANHIQKAQEIAGAVQQGQTDPQTGFQALMKILDHAGQHLQKLQANPAKQNEFKQLEAMWEELAQFTKQLGMSLQSESEQPNPEDQMQALDTEAQVEMRKDDMEHQRKLRKDDMDAQRKARKDAFNEQLAARKTVVNEGLQARKGAFDMGMQSRKMAHSESLANRKTATSRN